MERLKRIAAIHDISGVGKCSLTIALPVISATGVECACMPTAVLSTHTAVFQGYTVRDLSGDMLPMAQHWKKENIHFDGIYTGYMVSPAQGKLIEEIFDIISDENTMKIVDPVMGDYGKFYNGMGEDMANAFRSLCSKADVITPNITEASILSGLPYIESGHTEEYITGLMDYLKTLGAKKIILTGVTPDDSHIGNAAWDSATNKTVISLYERIPHAFHGTGDLFSSCLSAMLVRGADIQDAINFASELVIDGIKESLRLGIEPHFGAYFEGVLSEYTQKVKKLFENK